MFFKKRFRYGNNCSCGQWNHRKMPVSDSIKNELKTFEIEEDAIITQINKILDDELMKTTITNKFRTLTDYTKDDKYIAGQIFNILSSIIDYDIACIYFHSPDNSVQKELFLMKKTFL